MIKRYVKAQFDAFVEQVSERMENAFSPTRWQDRIKAWFGGVKQEELLIKSAFASKIEEVFIIHRQSGLLLACYSRNNTTDVDMIAGMLTAIKQFVEEAFRHGEKGALETIEYGSYKILIRDYYTYYSATVVSGYMDNKDKEALDEHLSIFCEKFIPSGIRDIDDKIYEKISNQLKLSFREYEALV